MPFVASVSIDELGLVFILAVGSQRSAIGSVRLAILGSTVASHSLNVFDRTSVARRSSSIEIPSLSYPSIGGLSFGLEFSIFGLGQRLSFGAVKIEPPVANEVPLVENGTVGTQEGVLGESARAVITADVEDLAFSLRVSVVAFKSSR